MKIRPSNEGLRPWQRRLHTIIFEAETPTGKTFDVLLLVAILLSVLAVVLESVAWINLRYHTQLRTVEWIFTVLFTIEYGLRLACVASPRRYATSFFGVVDLLAILPTYLIFIIPGAHELAVIRGLRLLRIFRIFKLGRFLGEAEALKIGLLRSRAKITVFLTTVLISVTIMGALMHLIEGGEGGFTDIPQGIYWAIVTMTTVGFGDITPVTLVGQVRRLAHDGVRLQPDHHSYRHHHRRVRPREPLPEHRDLPALHEDRPRAGLEVLQPLRREALKPRQAGAARRVIFKTNTVMA